MNATHTTVRRQHSSLQLPLVTRAGFMQRVGFVVFAVVAYLVWIGGVGIHAQSLPQYTKVASLSFQGRQLTGARFADLNGDGRADVLGCFAPVSAGGNSETVVWYQAADHTFPTATDLGALNYSCSSMAAGDVDGDGVPDLIISQGLVFSTNVNLPQRLIAYLPNSVPSSACTSGIEWVQSGGKTGFGCDGSGPFYFLGGKTLGNQGSDQAFTDARGFRNGGNLQNGDDVLITSDWNAVAGGSYGGYAESYGGFQQFWASMIDTATYWGSGTVSPFHPFWAGVPVERAGANNFTVITYQPVESRTDPNAIRNYQISYQVLSGNSMGTVTPLGSSFVFPVLPSNGANAKGGQNGPYSSTPRSMFNVWPWNLGTGTDDFVVADNTGSLFAVRHNGTHTWSSPQLMATYGQGALLLDAGAGGTNLPTYFLASDVIPNPAPFSNGGDGFLGATINVYTAPTAGGVAASSVAVASSVNPAAFQQSVSFRCSVSGQGTPTGLVTFLLDGASLGRGILSGGKATITASAGSMSLGNHTITCNYGGDTNNAAASGTMVETVGKQDTTTAIPSPPSPAAGQASVISAFSQSQTEGTLTGTVAFTVNGTSIGTGALDGSGNSSVPYTFPAPGSQTVTACYSGDANFNASCGTQTVTVGPFRPGATISSSANPSVVGASVTFTCTITAGGQPGTGFVNLLLDGASQGSHVALNNGSASFVAQSMTAGTHIAGCTWSGSNGSAAAARMTQTVGKGQTSMVVSPTPNPGVVNSTVNITGGVIPIGQSSIVATGTVTVSDAGSVIGTAPVGSGGQGVLPYKFPTAGNHPISACYSGDSNYQASCTQGAQIVTEQISAAPTTTAVVASPNPVQHTKTAVISATVSSGAGTPSGTVTFTADGTSIGSATVVNGAASINNASLSIGTHSIVATFAPSNGNYLASNGSTSLTVIPAPAVVTITSNQNPTFMGFTVTLTVNVTGEPGMTPTGSVQVSANGSALGTVALDATGTGQLQAAFPIAGTQNIVGQYGGDSTYKPASGTLALPVQRIPTSVTVQGTPNPSIAVINNTVTLQLLVQPTVTQPSKLASTPQVAPMTGSFGVTDNVTGTNYNALPVGRDGRYSINLSGLSTGPHAFSIVYSGDANYVGSTQSTFVQNVLPPVSGMNVIAAPTQPMPPGSTVQMAVRVSDPTGANQTSGTVTWTANGNTLGTSAVGSDGTSTFTTATLAPGSYNVFATYGGVEPGSSPAIPVNVTGITASVSTQSVAMSMGGNASLDLTLQSIAGYTGEVALACAGLPAPGSCLVPASVTLGNAPVSAKVTIAAVTETADSGMRSKAVLCVLLPAFGLAGLSRKRSKVAALLLVLVSVIVGGSMTGCGIGGNPVPASLVPGTYNVTVTATAGKQVVTSKVAVTIK